MAATLYVDKRDQMFVLNEMLDIEKLCGYPKFSEQSGFDMVLNEAHRFAKNEFVPTLQEGDHEGCVYDAKTHSVKFPGCFKKPYEKFKEGGWLAMCDDPEVGGDGFPMAMGTAVAELFYASGFYIFGAAELSHAGAKAIEKYGTKEQKDLYMSRLLSGEWMGSMCLTESDAGSDVGMIQTSAVPKGDGTFSISGTKIFITAGDQDLTENIIHMVLARIEGDPPGTRGLSLFIVPKFLSDQDGNLGERNDVLCMGIEHKMGLHGLATCTLAFGDNSNCTGYLLGDQGKGIVEMFNMMNEQRLLVGLQGLSYSSSAFLHAVDYASSRKQGPSTDPEDKKKAPQVPIINHPDIKRMLLGMKSHVEGGRALAYYVSMCIDYVGVTHGEEKAAWRGMVELLVPIVKAYLTHSAWENTGTAIQIAGGYGYCVDYPFERLARDCKVSSIYEGTNSIQAIDLVFRKILGNDLHNFNEFLARIDQTINKSLESSALRTYAVSLEEARKGLEQVVDHFVQLKDKNKLEHIYAKASPFLEAMGDVVIGWLHLWQLSLTQEKLEQIVNGTSGDEAIKAVKKKKADAFYYGKVLSAQYFIGTVLKRTISKFDEIAAPADPVLEMFDKAFTG